MSMLAIIGGTGVYNLSLFDQVEEKLVATPFGECKVILGKIKDKKVVFMTRHGVGHKIPPHQINYRANVYALKSLGVTDIVATTAVGSVDKELAPGTFVFCDQFIDFTKNRVNTFFDGGPLPVVHVDVTEPYCSSLRSLLTQVGAKNGLSYCSKGTYICTEGPRFETAAEIAFYNKFGGTVVGMTGVPEATLAREAEMCYVTVSMVTNLGAGLSEFSLTHGEVLEVMETNQKSFHQLISGVIESWQPKLECSCKKALKEFGGFERCMEALNK